MPIDVKAASPSPPPCTVTDDDPVPARFKRRVKLTDAKSTLIAAVKLPLRIPAVITTRLVP